MFLIKFKHFLNNIDDFKNFVPNPEPDADEKEKVEAIITRDKFAIQKMKEYINKYFRRNVSRIRWGYQFKINVDVNWIPKRSEEKWEKILVDENEWLIPFLTKTNKKLFEKFKFNRTIDQINSIVGVQYVFGPNYKTIIRNSKFNLNDALRVLKHYFIQEMLLFLDFIWPRRTYSY